MWIAIAIGVVIIVAISAYYITRFMKGSIVMNLDSATIYPGEPISGNLKLETKKMLEGSLSVSLIGTQVTTYYESDGDRKTRREEFFRDKVILERRTKFKAGSKKKYDFNVPSPEMRSPDFSNSKVGRLISGILSSGRNSRDSRMEWKVEARLDVKGVDLAASKRVNIPM